MDSEKIKIDGDRVDIEKLADDENAFPEITGGYLIQTDRPSAEDPEAWFNNGAGYIHEKPNFDDITTQQSAYIESVFRAFDQNAAAHRYTTFFHNLSPVHVSSIFIFAMLIYNPFSYASL